MIRYNLKVTFDEAASGTETKLPASAGKLQDSGSLKPTSAKTCNTVAAAVRSGSRAFQHGRPCRNVGAR
jgi:hypothetical protein